MNDSKEVSAVQRASETEPAGGGRTIKDPAAGEEITFLETPTESAADRVVMQLTVAPGATVSPHAHPFEEAFECLDGRIDFRLDGGVVDLRPGREVTALPGRLHGFRNAGDGPATLQIVATPGAVAEYGLRVRFLLGRDGYLPAGGGPPKHLLLLAVVLQRTGMYFPPLPRWLFRSSMAALAAVGRWRGREELLLGRYPEYARLLEALGKRPPTVGTSGSQR
jgi:quercetin dioxygenase-like cupin family protein